MVAGALGLPPLAADTNVGERQKQISDYLGCAMTFYDGMHCKEGGLETPLSPSASCRVGLVAGCIIPRYTPTHPSRFSLVLHT